MELFGRRFYRIGDYDRLAPFFMTVVGAGDAWLFVSSTGGLTAGRVAPDSALFPYYTDDKVAESAGRTGGLSLLRVTRPGAGEVLWEPFTSGAAGGRRGAARPLQGRRGHRPGLRGDPGGPRPADARHLADGQPVRHRAHLRADQRRRPTRARSSSSMGSSTCSLRASTSTPRTG